MIVCQDKEFVLQYLRSDSAVETMWGRPSVAQPVARWFRQSTDQTLFASQTEWDGKRLGTDQVRFVNVEGDTLSLKTEPNKSPVDGRDGVGVLTFSRVKPSRPQ